jgi:two-component system phosphate regulon sensor histidine kinase PhoR
MHEQATRMQRLVQDLLTLSRLESSETPLVEETIDLRRVVADLEVDARALSHQGHVIEVEAADVQLRGNRDELFSAFGNLVSNAVRYTPEGGHIRLRCHPVNDGFVFEVEDSGPGIAPEHLPRLTERFYRIDKSRSRETGGTGLGLAIVKHVLIRHQGRLDIHSQVGRGSTFTAWLPRTRIVEPSAP